MNVVARILMSLALVSSAVVPAFAGCTQPGESSHAATGALAPSLRGRPVFARIHADWCSACKATQPTVDALRAKYGSTVSFVEFDVTDAKTSAAAAEKAKTLGLSAFYEENKTVTSTVAVMNPANGAIVDTFYNDSNASDYEKAIARARSLLRIK